MNDIRCWCVKEKTICWQCFLKAKNSSLWKMMYGPVDKK